MNCPKCAFDNPEDHAFCIRCGWNLSQPYEQPAQPMQQTAQSPDQIRDLVLLGVGILYVVHSVFWLVITQAGLGWDVIRWLNLPFLLVNSAIPLVLAFFIRNKTFKIVAFVLGGISIVWSLISQITQLIAG